MYEKLLPFLQQHAENVDIFCFQEVFSTASDKKSEGEARVNILQEIQKVLPKHKTYFTSALEGFEYFSKTKVDYDLSVGTAILAQEGIHVDTFEAPVLYEKKNIIDGQNIITFPKTLQTIRFGKDIGAYSVCNVHGPWFPGEKYDNEVTIQYCQDIRDSLKKIPGKKVLCGDFNLRPDTESIGILEKDLRNLVTEHNIQSTRPAFFEWPTKHADYIFTSPEVEVKEFKVFSDEVSDHLPLYIEFN